jgi:mitochondrial fission protein ELM1
MNILWVKDGKKGHEKQVAVLLEELNKIIDIRVYEELTTISKLKKFFFFIDYISSKLEGFFRKDYSLISGLTNKQRKKFEEKQFDVVVGAGSGPHIELLKYKHEFNVKIISVLTPSFFKERYDLICSPNHDNNKFRKKDNVIFFNGSLARVSNENPFKNLGFIGIGGKNKHFVFNQKKLYQQIEYVISIYPDLNWKIFPSRRTPTDMLNDLHSLILKYENIKICEKNIDETIKNACIKIVTQDSVNMVFECLSTKGETYLFNMKYFKKNKIVNLMNSLLENKQVGYIENSQMVDGLHKIKMIRGNKHHDIFAEVEKVAYQISKRLSL